LIWDALNDLLGHTETAVIIRLDANTVIAHKGVCSFSSSRGGVLEPLQRPKPTWQSRRVTGLQGAERRKWFCKRLSGIDV